MLHVDMDAFFASVEQRDDPSLRGKPVLVGHDGLRGVVAAASYEARVFGCRSAMPIAVAKRLCPHAVIIRGNGKAYREASDLAFTVFEKYTPLVQPVSIDEAYLDVTGSLRLFGEPETIAADIRAEIRATTALTASVGVAPNKFAAKIASDLNKPDGLAVIRPHEVAQRLAPLPATVIPGLGPASEKRLRALGVRTIGDIAALPLDTLRLGFGDYAQRLHMLARGEDDRPVTPDREAKSVGHEQTFEYDLADPEEVRGVLLAQVEQVGRRLRKKGRLARTVTLKIRFGDFQTVTRAHTLEEPTDRTDVLWDAARTIFDRWAQREGFRHVRLIGVSASGFTDHPQANLFPDPREGKVRQLDRATDAIAARFGKEAITRAAASPRAKRRV